MKKDIQFLKRRAKEFWERGEEDFRKQRYNLCALDVEQTLQLWLKYLLFLKAGDFPKTHYFETLINTLVEVYNLPLVKSFYQENLLQFKSLEDAYLTSRYLPREFSRQEAEKLKEFAWQFLKILEKTTNEKFI